MNIFKNLPIFYLFFSLILLPSCIKQSQVKPKDAFSKESISFSEGRKLGQIIKPENGFNCGIRDSKGILWFGTRGNGVYRFDGESFQIFNKKNGLCSNEISCISEDSKGNLLFGTPIGICKFDRTSFSIIEIPQSDTSSIWLDKVYPVVNPNQVVSILEDKKGNLWIGTNGAGVYRYDGKSFSQFLSNIGKVYEDGLYHNIVLSIVEDLQGDIWFSSLSHAGVSKYNGESFSHYLEDTGLSDDFVRTVHCDRKGNIWIGTHGNNNGGLDKYDGETFTNYHKTDDGLSHNNVRWIYEDPKGELWLGSGTSNLSIFDGVNFREFESNDGEKYDKVLFIIGDELENIWFGGVNGLWKYDGKSVLKMTSA